MTLACAHEVEALPVAHDKAVNLIETAALEVEARSVADDPNQLTEMIGHYRIVSQLGVGGMGEVYFADDAKLDRKLL